MKSNVKNCIVEDFYSTPLILEAAIEFSISQSLFTQCKSDDNGGVIRAQGNCQNIYISKVCSEGCTSTGGGQFMYSNINDQSYQVNISYLIISDSQSSGGPGIMDQSKYLHVANTNFSFLSSSYYPAICVDHSRNGCLVSYSIMISCRCSTHAIFSLQEIESTGQNLLNNCNVLNNTCKGTLKISIVFIIINNILQKCNFHGNEGDGYLFLLDGSTITISECSIQDTFGGKKDKICSVSISIESNPFININVNAPKIEDCAISMNASCNFGNKKHIYKICQCMFLFGSLLSESLKDVNLFSYFFLERSFA